jgi:hypothetical protein
MPLFGHTTTLRIFIDPDLLQCDEEWAVAGNQVRALPSR